MDFDVLGGCEICGEGRLTRFANQFIQAAGLNADGFGSVEVRTKLCFSLEHSQPALNAAAHVGEVAP